MNKNDNSEFCRKLRLAEFFHNTDYSDDSVVKSKSNFCPRSGRNNYLDMLLNSIKNIPVPTKKHNAKYNVSYLERQAFTTLEQREDIILKEADKGSSVVLMNKEFYISKAEEIIHDWSAYQQIQSDEDTKLMKKIQKFVVQYETELTKKEISYLTHFEFKTSNLYCFLKVHKSKSVEQAMKTQESDVISVHAPDDLKIRLIIAGSACPTHRLSHVLDQLLQ